MGPILIHSYTDHLFRQIFPLYADPERIPSKNSALAQIRQKCKEIKERNASTSMGA